MRYRTTLVLAGLALIALLAPVALQWRAGIGTDVLLLVLGTAAVVGTLGAAGVTLGRPSSARIAAWGPWLACGALTGAALIGPIRATPWLFGAATAFFIIGCLRGVGGVRGLLTRGKCLVAATLMTFAMLWTFLTSSSRPASYFSAIPGMAT